MKQKTHIANVLESNHCKDQYDTQVKKILSDKTVLAWILKYTTAEFKRYSIPLIKQCIEGSPEVGTHRVFLGLTLEKEEPEAITGLDTADKVPGEGEVTYDVRFYVLTPAKKRVKMIINVEGQKNFYPGYDLVTRGVFYCARLLSAQKDTEFTKDNYDDIKKVYSIWICMNVPASAQHTVTSYRFGRHDLYGTLQKRFRYDLMELIMVCLGGPKSRNKGNRLHGMLDTLLSPDLLPEEKEKILTEDYGIETSVELEGGLREMCNLSDLIEERGIEKGIEKGIAEGDRLRLLTQIQKKLVKGKSLEQIADELEETVETILPLYTQVQED